MAGCHAGEVCGQRGAASVYVLGGVVLLTTLLMVVGTVSVARIARHSAQAAADLAALAAASRAVSAPQLACVDAARVAASNGARLRSCRPGPRVGEVVVEVEGPPLHVPWSQTPLPGAHAAARAG